VVQIKRRKQEEFVTTNARFHSRAAHYVFKGVLWIYEHIESKAAELKSNWSSMCTRYILFSQFIENISGAYMHILNVYI
jgi:hypothetical protein